MRSNRREHPSAYMKIAARRFFNGNPACVVRERPARTAPR
jgi:hypothetical protein